LFGRGCCRRHSRGISCCSGALGPVVVNVLVPGVEDGGVQLLALQAPHLVGEALHHALLILQVTLRGRENP
jgi:hypothetical protein